MRLIRGLHNLTAAPRPCVATIGNFDGVHLGHQAVLRQVRAAARARGLPAVVITFEPYPREFFAGDTAPPRLTRLREKLIALNDAAIDGVVILRFDRHLATMTGDAFVRRVLVDGLQTRHLVVGDDFRFGHQRHGDFALLQRAGEEYGYSVEHRATFDVGGARVSSTRVREALARGDLELAALLLGRPYAMCGRVARGAQRGRQLGFPTANIHLHRRATPLAGVFAVRMHGVAGQPLPGVANIGTRPTVDGTRALLEVHLFDFNADIYGHYVQVDFVTRIRDEQRFATLDALKTQIAHDAQRARELLQT